MPSVGESRADLAALLRGYSLEVTIQDLASLKEAEEVLQPGTEVFVASLAKDATEGLVLVAKRLRRAGLSPVPHIVARGIPDLAALDLLVARLAAEAGVRSALVVAGDRSKPLGELESSLQIIRSGVLPRHGIRRILMSAYPEGHPRIPTADLIAARTAKLVAAVESGIDVELVSQFCFERQPIISLAEELRDSGIKTPLRIGVAGLANRARLLKYALLCGIGSSIRAVKEHPGLMRNTVAGESPEALLQAIARARAAHAGLLISGVHFFPFGALRATAGWADRHVLCS